MHLCPRSNTRHAVRVSCNARCEGRDALCHLPHIDSVLYTDLPDRPDEICHWVVIAIRAVNRRLRDYLSYVVAYQERLVVPARPYDNFSLTAIAVWVALGRYVPHCIVQRSQLLAAGVRRARAKTLNSESRGGATLPVSPCAVG